MRAHFRHRRSNIFSMIYRTPQAIEFWPLKSLAEVLGVHLDSISQSGNCLGSVRVHSLTLSYTPGSMWCDSRAFSWPTPLQPLCLGREPKARVATYPPISLEHWPLEVVMPFLLASKPALLCTLIGPWCRLMLKTHLIVFFELLFLNSYVMQWGL